MLEIWSSAVLKLWNSQIGCNRPSCNQDDGMSTKSKHRPLFYHRHSTHGYEYYALHAFIIWRVPIWTSSKHVNLFFIQYVIGPLCFLVGQKGQNLVNAILYMVHRRRQWETSCAHTWKERAKATKRSREGGGRGGEKRKNSGYIKVVILHNHKLQSLCARASWCESLIIVTVFSSIPSSQMLFFSRTRPGGVSKRARAEKKKKISEPKRTHQYQ